MTKAIQPLLAVGGLTLALLLSLACKTPPATSAANSSSEKRDTLYEAGVLVFKVREDLKTTLPAYDHSAPALGTYPHLGDLLPTYRVRSITPFIPQSGTSHARNYYKIAFDPSVSLDEFIAALDRIDIIEYTEKVPVNSPKNEAQ